MPTRLRSQTLRFLIQTSQGKSYTVTFATGLLVLIMMMVALFPAASSIFARLTENTQREGAVEQINSKLTNIRTLAAKEQTARTLSVAISDLIPNGFNQDDVLAELLTLANQNQVNLINYRTADLEPTADSLRALGALSSKASGKIITLTVDGGRGQLENLIAALENSIRVFNIRSISYSLLTSTQDIFVAGTAFRMTITFETYFWALPEPTI